MNQDISIDISQAVKDLGNIKRSLSTSNFNTALARTINRVVMSGRTQASREIRKKYKIKKADLDKKLRTQKASRAKLNGQIITWGTPLPVKNFKPIQRKKGVSINIAGKRKTIDHAFIATMKSGYVGVFMRGKYRAQGFEYIPGGRLPITQLVTVSQGVMFANPQVMDRTRSQIDSMFGPRLEHEIKAILRGFAKG